MPRLNLDEFIKEQSEDPYIVEIGEQEFEVPADIPWPALKKYSGLNPEDIDAETVTDMLSLVFGKKQHDEMVEAGLRPGSTAEFRTFAGVMQYLGENLMGEEAMGKIMQEMQPNRTNGKTKPKPKAKRSASR